MDESNAISCSPHSGPMSLDGDREDVTEARDFLDQTERTPSTNDLSIGSRPIPVFLGDGLRSIQELPQQYRHVFGEYPCFNRIQSLIFDTVFYSAEPLVVSAPTGSGKTVIFELAIIHLLKSFKNTSFREDFKIVYMAPVKALCTEKLHEWARKFSKLNINCLEVTGDSDVTDLNYLKKHQLILTTPEKWDSLTRRWRDHSTLMKTVRLFMIDEVHILNEEGRGPTLEAVVSRMKMLKQQQHSDDKSLPSLRFVAVSATIPNVEDLAQWLGNHEVPAKFFKVPEDMRPVKLLKVVKGYDCNLNGYLFDIHLSYKVKQVITQYSEGKPTLVFCSTRKSVLATAGVLSKMVTFSLNPDQKTELIGICNQIVDNKIRELVNVGIGCHHAGLIMSDRNLLEKAFRDGLIPVLIATSTLAMGVNLPAHLVVIKSTQFYGNGGYQDYSDSQLLQMMGRAGRPQFDTAATAVIMTKTSCEKKFMRLTAGTDPIQSSLHRHLVEHLNAEVVLGTVTDLPAAVDWMRSTFFFVRANRQPQHYGLAVPAGDTTKINFKLQDMVQVKLNGLAKYKLVETNGMDVRDTPSGRLMARYYVTFQTMQTFLTVCGEESLSDLLGLLSQASEFQDVQLRNDEKSSLNTLNSKKDGAQGLRFPIKGRIKDRNLKVNCLLQAVLGGLHLTEPALQQEASRVVRTAERLSKCLLELVQLSGQYSSLLHAVLLHKCVRCQLWETTALAARQLPRIGPVLATLLVAAGKTSFRAIAQSNPRDLERIVNRLPPFGDELRNAAAAVPQLTLSVELQRDGGATSVKLIVDIANLDKVANDSRHWIIVLAGDSDNNVLIYDRFPCSKLLQGSYLNQVDVSDSSAETIKVHLISEMWVGVDAEKFIRIKDPVPVTTLAPPKPTKRKTLMDKMREVTSCMDDMPSFRLQVNQDQRNDNLTLSQRFEQFRRTQAKRLPSLMSESNGDPEDPGDRASTPWRGARPEQVRPGEDDVDPWDVQVVPDYTTSTSSARIEYSAYPHQPTIRNFFKTQGGAEAVSTVSVTASPKSSRFDLDDSWDEDILTAVPSGSPPLSPSAPGYVERRAGCWNPNFDIGIEELLRLSDEEGGPTEEKELDFDKWCDEPGDVSHVPGDGSPPTAPAEQELDFDQWCEVLGDISHADSDAVGQKPGKGWPDDEMTAASEIQDKISNKFGHSDEWPGDEELRQLSLPCSSKQSVNSQSSPADNKTIAVENIESVLCDESQDLFGDEFDRAVSLTSETSPTVDDTREPGVSTQLTAICHTDECKEVQTTNPPSCEQKDEMKMTREVPMEELASKSEEPILVSPGAEIVWQQPIPGSGVQGAIGSQTIRSETAGPGAEEEAGENSVNKTQPQQKSQDSTVVCVALRTSPAINFLEAQESAGLIAVEAIGRPSSPTPASSSRKEFQLTTQNKATVAPAISSSVNNNSKPSKTLQIVTKAHTQDSPCNLLKYMPKENATVPTDDVLARLLATFSDNRPPLPGVPGQATTATSSYGPHTHPAAPAAMYSRNGMVSGGPARRAPKTPAEPAAPVAPEEKKLDFVERILGEGVPYRLLGSARTVNINTERLRNANRGHRATLSKQLAKGLAEARAICSTAGQTPVTTASSRDKQGSGTADHRVSSDTKSSALVGGTVEFSSSRSEKTVATSTDAEPEPRTAPPASLQDPHCTEPQNAVVKAIAGPPASAHSKGVARRPGVPRCVAESTPMSVSARRIVAPQSPERLDWFERMVSEPIGSLVRRPPPSHPWPQAAVAKRKRRAEEEAVPRELKRPPSVWNPEPPPASHAMHGMQGMMAFNSQSSGSSNLDRLRSRWGALAVTASRASPVDSPSASPHPAPGDWRNYPTHVARSDSLDFQDEFMPRPSIGRKSMGSPAAVPRDETPPRLGSDLDTSFARHRQQSARDFEDNFTGQDMGNEEITFFSRSSRSDCELFGEARGSSPCSSRGRDDRDQQVVSPSLSWNQDDDDALSEYPKSNWDDFHDDSDVFVRGRYAEEDEDCQLSWIGHCSPSYSPAPPRESPTHARAGRAFKWQPSLPSRNASPLDEMRRDAYRDEQDPFAYRPQSTRARGSPPYRSRDFSPTSTAPSVASSSGGERVVVPPTPAPGSRLVIALSPPPRKEPVVSYSKWDSYLD